MRIIDRIFKKLILSIMVLIFALSLSIITSSYTLAEIKSNVGITITDSENALIGVSSTINGGTIEKEVSQDGRSYLPVSNKIPVSIKNNMNTVITVTGRVLDNSTDLDVELLNNTCEIKPGGTGTIMLQATAYHSTREGLKRVRVNFDTYWIGGNAVLDSNVNIEIKEPELVNNSTKNNIETFTLEYDNNPFYEDINQDICFSNVNKTWIDILHQQNTMIESNEIDRTVEIKMEYEQNEIEKIRNKKVISELYQRCIKLIAGVQSSADTLVKNKNYLALYSGMNNHQSVVDEDMVMELYQDYIVLQSELQTLYDNTNKILINESSINESEILNISRQLTNYEIYSQSLYERYMWLISQKYSITRFGKH